MTGLPANPIASSAAAKIEKHLKVPVHDKPGESLVKKVQPAASAASKSTDKKMRVHTIRHAGCVEFGHDKFDEKTTDFLSEIGEANLIGVHMTNYTYLDVGTQKIFMDFGVLIIYRG